MKGYRSSKTLILNGAGYIIKSHVFAGKRPEKAGSILK